VTYHLAFSGAQTQHATGPIGWFVGVGILTYIHWQLALRSFALIHQLPDRVTRWFGQGGENLGEEHEARSAIGAVVSHTSGRVEGLAKMAGGTAGMKGLKAPDSAPKDGGAGGGGGGGGKDKPSKPSPRER
jgi:hypothetical protein